MEDFLRQKNSPDPKSSQDSMHGQGNSRDSFQDFNQEQDLNNSRAGNTVFDESFIIENKKASTRSFLKGMAVGTAVTLSVCLALVITFVTFRNMKDKSSVLDSAQEEKLNQLNDYIDQFYYEDVSDEARAVGIYKGLMESTGDPYTEYYTEEEYKELMEDLTGTFSGIGALLSVNEEKTGFKINEVYEGSAAEAAGIKAGDIVTEVDGRKTAGQDMSEFIRKYIRGQEGTLRKIKYTRNGKETEVSVVLRKVVTPSVSHQMLDNGIGYIKITEFSEGTKDAFEEALKELKEQGMTKVIYDLRTNGGGLVNSATAILDDILPKGKTVYTIDKNGTEQDYNSDAEKDLDIPAVVLVSENTASAAEIFTGAMRDYKRATIIGTKTFGKGIVQSTIPLSDGSAIKVTSSRYYTPKGECIHGKGIEPDIELEYSFMGGEEDEYSIDLDNQIQKAIEVLNK